MSVKQQFFNRELSLLQFNHRVLEQAQNAKLPLLERLRFLAILSSNLDEFFEIRVASLKQRISAELTADEPDGMRPAEILEHISEMTHQMVSDQYRALREDILPKLNAEGIVILEPKEWTPKLRAWAEKYFRLEVLPVLTPLGLDSGHPFPQIQNKSLNFIVSLEGEDAFGRDINVAVVPAPRALPRFIALPTWYTKCKNGYISLATLVSLHVEELFSGLIVKSCHQFRLTRNSNLFVDEEEVDDLLLALEGQLNARKKGGAVRLEIEKDCPKKLVKLLMGQFKLKETEVYLVNGPVNLNRMMDLIDAVNRQDLKYPSFTPGNQKILQHAPTPFDAIKRSDMLMHHPFDSFAPVVEFLRYAAKDPKVLAIKQTLYRTGMDSVMADYLIQAAESGKEVTVVIELRARFDEQANISIANRLQKAGAHVVYGIVGYKTHSKMLLVVRREGKNIKHYAHLGTGNYHSRTARLYTDYGFLTANQAICKEVGSVFLQLTGSQKQVRQKKLLVAPADIFMDLTRRIQREMRHAKAGEKSLIQVRVNGLTDPEMIRLLYRASRAGVKIDLLVRGTCALVPGVKGMSENISVRSVVGRFLEHTRVYYFYNGGKEQVYLSSADWMTRNLFKRIEIAFPIEDETLKQRVIEESFTNYLKDNVDTWVLSSLGKYEPIVRPKVKRYCAQEVLLKTLAG